MSLQFTCYSALYLNNEEYQVDWIMLWFSKLKKQIELGRYSSMYADVNDNDF